MSSTQIRRDAICVLVTDTRFTVLVRDKSDQRWTFPGGGIDDGERDHTACLREFREEAGFPFPDKEPYALVHISTDATATHFFFTIKEAALIKWAKQNNNVELAKYTPYDLSKNSVWKGQTNPSFKEMDQVVLVSIEELRDSVNRQSDGNGGVMWPVKYSVLKSVRNALDWF